MAHIPGLATRRSALQLVDAVVRRGETLEQAERRVLAPDTARADRALAKALASESLRWLSDLDALIDSATRKRLPDDAKARAVLRLMLAGWLRLKTPPHAVIATGLALLSGGPRRLAHGVFSTLARAKVTLPDAPSLPPQVKQRWGDRAAQIAQGLGEPPPLDLALRDPRTAQDWAEMLGGRSLMQGHVRTARGTPIEELAGYQTGEWWVQDLAAQIPARLLGQGGGRRVLDLCAAPGGKTMQLAAAGWQVSALDSSKQRLAILHDNLKRTKLAAEVICADALAWEVQEPFDAILLDAPCTATGTCRRHPDVLHRVGPPQIKEMRALQRALIARAASWLSPGGVLVYTVCSLEAEEGEAQAAWAIDDCKLARVPIEAALPHGLALTPEGDLRTHPGMLGDAGGLDGFFAVCLRRSDDEETRAAMPAPLK